ncbi:MAG: hypothetical protein EB127_16005 [Alphaproteobacteria bacterium]|nr:hypothetical protein [Alphaproteobacteria bacterium]
MKKPKLSVVKDNSKYGIYVWRLPDGSIFADQDRNVLNIPSEKGDLTKISEIRKAAAHYGQPDGDAVFIPGVGRVSEEEYQQDLERMESGLLTYGDTGAWRDAARARRTLGS